MIARFRGIAEQKRDTPQRGERDQNVDDPADNARLTSEEEADDVELKQTYAAPVDAADDQQRQRNFIQHR